MFTKLDELLSNKESVDDLNRTKLQPIDAMDISNIIAENVVSGGVRRSSQICLFDAEDEDIAEAKSGLYKQVDGEWVIDESIAHRQMSNNSIMYYSKPDREKLHKHIEDLRFSGEPGFINAEEASRRRDNFEGVNPCFTGDMKLLTAEGYKTFEELNGRNDVPVVNINGDVTNGKVWSNGVKDIIKLTLSNDEIIKCTPDHKFMLKDGSNKLAENLLGETLKSHEGENVSVISVETFDEEEVYDFNEPVTHWGVVEGVIAHNCAEILLDSRGVCNLTSLNVMSFVEDGKLNKEELFKGQKMSARAGYRMAQIEFELNDWDRINKRDRLIGTSMTGWQDMVNATDLSRDEEIELLEDLKEVAHDEAEKIANKLDGNVPELITTVKPEGTQTQMPTVSSGLHFSHSAYYIRRVRISASDPLVETAEDLGWNVKNEVGQEGEDLTTKVIEFPVKAPEGKVKGDVSAIEQLEIYKMFMEHYVDHNASITVHVRDDEWEDVEEWLWNNWDSVVGVSFISYSDNFYDFMPYEEITEEEYNEMVEDMEEFKPSLINEYERKNKGLEREINDAACESGICPVR